MKEKEHEKIQLEKLMKEIKQLRNKIDNLEVENRNLKKSIFDLTNQVTLYNNKKVDPFLDFSSKKSDTNDSNNSSNSALNDGVIDNNRSSNNSGDNKLNQKYNKMEFYTATKRETSKNKNQQKRKLFNIEHELTGHKGAIYVIKYSWDGNYVLSGSFDKTVKLWDLDKKKEIQSFNQHGLNVSDITTSRTNATLVSASFDSTIRYFDINSNKLLSSVKTKGFPQCIQYGGENSNLIATGTSRKYLTIIDSNSYNDKSIMEAENDSMINTLHIPDNKGNIIFTGDSKGLIKTWDLRYLNNKDGKASPLDIIINDPTNKPISYLCQPINSTNSTTLGVNSYDNINRIYKISNNSSSINDTINDSIANEINNTIINNNNRLTMTHSLQGYKNLNWPIRCSMLAVNKKLLNDSSNNDKNQWHLFATGSSDPHAYVYLIGPEEDDAQLLQRLDGHKGRIYDISFNPKESLNCIATASADCTIKLWNINSSSK
ncbi:WD40 repeat-like protein [Neoconidiobolus thromboides FSU 785]|nr:WD40 repeat-like protein [Neoconidiobolus thromboides FSU 785]